MPNTKVTRSSIPIVNDHDDVIDANDICDYLNLLMSIDAKAIKSILGFMVRCNSDLFNNKTGNASVVARQLHSESANSEYCVGVLGIINGMLCDYLAIAYDNEGETFKVCIRDSHPDDVEVL